MELREVHEHRTERMTIHVEVLAEPGRSQGHEEIAGLCYHDDPDRTACRL